MALDPDGRAVVVGAGLAGLRAAETLRAEGHRGPLTLVGAERHLPYDRPPLSKQYLAGTWGLDRVTLRPKEKLDELGAELRLGVAATACDTAARTVTLDDGATLAYDGLVVATGSRPRLLPGTAGHPRVHALRTLDDAQAIAAALDGDGRRVVVVGAGFIGGEVAATCHGRGAAVTVLEALSTPLERVLGEEMGSVVAGLHADHGVAIRTGVGVSAVSPPADGPVEVTLDDGTSVVADVVVVGVGVVPATDWLAGSGLEVADGVVADSRLVAGPDVVVAGDLASWEEPGAGERVRIEHWTNAAEQAVVAARNLLAPDGGQPYAPVPYFWSDQYEVKIQVIGRPRASDEVVVVPGSGSTDERRFVALYGRDGRLTAALGFGRPRQLMAYRPLLERGASFDEALAASG